jgi:hypothetical protein
MAIRKVIFAVLAGLFFAGPPSFAQEVQQDNFGQGNYYIDSSEGEPRFIQRLMWEHTDYVLRYEVTVEKLSDNEEYVQIERYGTEENFAVFSLTAGSYRFHVDLYDLFDDLAYTTDWHEFEIIRALRPELISFTPQIFYLSAESERKIILRGHNLIPESEIYLVREDTVLGYIMHPMNIDTDGDYAIIELYKALLVPGEYAIYVRNPGGMEAQLGTFKIATRPPANPIFTTVGFSAGTSFVADPLAIITVHGTYSPLRNFFVGAGVDFGFISSTLDTSMTYWSVYPFVNIGAFVPFENKSSKGGWYIGAGIGYMYANYTFEFGEDNGTAAINAFVPLELFTGFNIGNFINISLSMRKSDFSDLAPNSIKLSIGIVKRF